MDNRTKIYVTYTIDSELVEIINKESKETMVKKSTIVNHIIKSYYIEQELFTSISKTFKKI